MSDQQSPGPWEGRSEVRGLGHRSAEGHLAPESRGQAVPILVAEAGAGGQGRCRVTWTQGGTRGHGWVRHESGLTQDRP